MERFGKEFFNDVLGMSPRVASFFSSLVSHTLLDSAVVNVNGKLWDSAFDIQLKGFPKYGFPWAGISHQAFYNTIMAGGMSSWAALGAATSHAGWSFYLSSSVYGIKWNRRDGSIF